MRRYGWMAVVACGVLALVPAGALATNYGVIFSGGIDKENNYLRYDYETYQMWQVMTGTLGYAVENVYVLFADGTDPAEDRHIDDDEHGTVFIDSDWSDIVLAGGHIEAATYDNLRNRLAFLQGAMTPEDCFYFWSFDHGYNTFYQTDAQGHVIHPAVQDEGGLCTWGWTWVRDDEFAAWVDPFDVKTECYAFGECFAGDMVDDLNIAGGDNRFAAYAADWYEPSYGSYWVAAWREAIESGLRSTHEIGDYAMTHDLAALAGKEHPGWVGADFHIVTNEAIPEPLTALSICLGWGALARYARRRRRD